jgi:hypothetical protein
MRLAILLSVLLAACGSREASPRDDGSAPAPRATPPAGDVDCVRDEDCALLPEITCCGECRPVPPFEVGTQHDLDARLIESEERCAHDTRACTPPVCTPMPRGCFARAACKQGRCVVDSEGCP